MDPNRPQTNMLPALERLSLRHTLLLAIAGLTGLVLLLAVVLANHEVRQTARMVAEERLERVVDQLAGLAARSAQDRLDRKLRIGSHPVIVAALREGIVDTTAVDEILEELRAPGDTGLPIEIWNPDGELVHTDRRAAGPMEPRSDSPVRVVPPGRPRVPLDTIPAYGSFYDADGEVRYYSTSPVVDGPRVTGWIVQERRVGSPRLAAEIEQLIGNESRVLFSMPGDSLWVTLAGAAVAAPIRQPPFDSTIVIDRRQDRYLVHAKRVEGTPWTVLVEMPQSAVAAGSGAFLRHMMVVGLLLMVGAGIVAVIVSRRLTGPLRELAAAADAIAAGDYTRRVSPASSDELRRVADAYNAMTQQVSTSHAELNHRLDEARALAARLEATTLEAEQAREAAQAADRAKSEFLATMSHEIRTPINAVLGFCDLLELDGTDDETRREYLRRTRRAARQLSSLVSDVLDLAKVDAGRIEMQRTTASVRDAVDASLALLHDDVRRQELCITVDVPHDLHYLGDPQRAGQILLNLLSNAVKFTKRGGEIRVRATREEDADGRSFVRIDVEDTGIGIAADEHDRIFEPFVQAQSGYTRQYGGTGLGLSISRRFARLMGGDIAVRSAAGAGSCFTVLLPAALPAEVAAK